MTDPRTLKEGSGSVPTEKFNAIVDVILSGLRVTASNVDSGAAQDGDVLTADGAGGASWEAGGGGSQSGSWQIADFEFQEPSPYTLTVVDKDEPSVSIAGDHAAEFAAGKTFTLADSQSVALAITAVNQGTKTFTIDTDVASSLPAGQTFSVSGSSGNDGTYTTVSANATTITVVEVIPDATGDGVVILDSNDGDYTVASSAFNAGTTTVTTVEAIAAWTQYGDIVRDSVSATFAIAEGTTVLDIWTYTLSIFGSTLARFSAGDGSQSTGYYNGLKLTSAAFMNHVYDPTQDTIAAFGAMTTAFSHKNANYSAGNPAYYQATLVRDAFEGLGVPYATDDTLTMTVYDCDNGGGAGRLRARVIYIAPIDAVAAS